MLAIQTILHPTDFSPRSEAAFRVACALARDYGARLLVLHVLERPLFIYSGVMAAPPDPEPSAEERRAVREKLSRVTPPDDSIAVEHLLVEGDPSTAILQVSQEHRCDLIVVGSHGRTGLTRLLLGSVAEQVLRKAACPVLTVTGPFPAAPAQAAPAEEMAIV